MLNYGVDICTCMEYVRGRELVHYAMQVFDVRQSQTLSLISSIRKAVIGFDAREDV